MSHLKPDVERLVAAGLDVDIAACGVKCLEVRDGAGVLRWCGVTGQVHKVPVVFT